MIFLALRYLRNVFSHARLKGHEREYLEQRGLQAQVDSPDERLLDRAARVASEMAGYISRAGLFSTGTLDRRLVAGTDLHIALDSLTRTDDWLDRLLTPDRLQRVWRRNFEALDWWLTNNPAPEVNRVQSATGAAFWGERLRAPQQRRGSLGPLAPLEVGQERIGKSQGRLRGVDSTLAACAFMVRMGRKRVAAGAGSMGGPGRRVAREDRMSQKQEALRLIQGLADDCSTDDILAELFFKKQVDAGLRDVAEGRVVTHDELRARIAKWRDSAGR